MNRVVTLVGTLAVVALTGCESLGTTMTSALFLLTILGLVVYLTLTRKDEIPPVTV